jgi:surface carbohydrate biosynthesis protein
MNNQTKPAIYLPLEICKRELWSHAFLSTKLALEGARVYVFESTYFDSIGWPYKGIYIGKNCFRNPGKLVNHKFYLNMKNQGVNLWFLDQEGGFFNGSDRETSLANFSARFDLKILDKSDKIFCWGKWQYHYYFQQKLKAELHITGHPNFDIYQPKYSQAFQNWDTQNTQNFTEFVLINTSFSSDLSNHSKSKDLLIFHSQDRHNLVMDEYTQNNIRLFLMLFQVREIAQRLRDTLFVVRPHPGENPSFYQSYLNDLPNVLVIGTGDVGSWIRKSKVVIHNRCTTGVQADIAQKPVISLEFSKICSSIGDSGSFVLGQVGHPVVKTEDLIELIQNPVAVNQQDKPWMETISNLNAIDTIVDIYKNNYNQIPVGSINNKYSDFKVLSKKIKGFIKDKFILDKYYADKMFDRQLFLKFPEMVRLASTFYGQSVIVRKISNYCYEVINE